jgi:hypothetical protein
LNKNRRVEESAAKAPAYIVTFSTLVTLLLAFFVVLVSMGSARDDTLLNQGQGYKGGFLGAFKKGFGVRQKLDLGNIGNKYPISDTDEGFEGRTPDADTERLRRIIKKLSRSMKISPSPIAAQKTDFSVTNIHFLPGEAALNEPAKEFLTEFCLNLQQSVAWPPWPYLHGLSTGSLSGEARATPGSLKLYVLGLAGDEINEKKQWIISAKRAQAAAEFLRNTLPAEAHWSVYSWGAGAGGDWVEQYSPVSEQSQILIAVLRDGD